MFGFVVTKKRISGIMLAVMLFALLLSLILFKSMENVKAENLDPATDRVERIAFIENMGYKVNRDIPEEKKEVEIPYIFGDIYGEYEKIQQKAGYNLKKYAGQKVTLYTYSLEGENRQDVYAHLLVADGFIIGGDISALSVEDGYINPLLPKVP